jgi:hypothetical protein
MQQSISQTAPFPSSQFTMNISSHFSKALAATFLVTSIAQTSLPGESLPDMRPALVGNGPKSLVNLINGRHVMERGFQHGALYFIARIDPNGFPSYSKIYGETDKIRPLRDEVRERLAEARFIPAVYHHQHVYAWMSGTVAFTSTDGKPHLRVFANQELSELEKESDFIAPQTIWLPGKIYDYAKWKDPFGSWWSAESAGSPNVSLTVDASGQVKDAHLESLPSGTTQAHADAALLIIRQQLYLPAYRNGKPVDSTTHPKLYFVIPIFQSLR